MKQLKQSQFIKNGTEHENISSPETSATSTRVVSISIDKYGKFQYTTDGVHYTELDPQSGEITSVDTIYQNESALPENEPLGTILPAYTNGSVPVKLYEYTEDDGWVEKALVNEYSIYYVTDKGTLYIFIDTDFVSTTPEQLIKEITIPASLEMTEDEISLLSANNCILAEDVITTSGTLPAGTILTQALDISGGDGNYYAGMYITDFKIGSYRIQYVSGTGKKIFGTDGKVLRVSGLSYVNGKSIPNYPADTGKFNLQMVDGLMQWSADNSVSKTSTPSQFYGTDANGDQTTYNLSSKQDTIDASHKLSADLVDDTNTTNKFVTTAEKNAWNGKQNALDSTQMDAVNSGANTTNIGQITTNANNITTNTNDIATINGKIPNEASSSNQLADKSFVNSTIQTATANFRGNWATWSAVPTTATDYPTDYAGNKTPTVNDYLVVQDASGYTGQTLTGTWRFKYSGVWSTDGKNGWLPEYQVNETPLTSAQLQALNSGITNTLVGQITTNENNITSLGTSKQDALVSGTNIKTINGNSVLGSGDITIQAGQQVDVQINGTSIVSSDIANIITNSAYNASSNKIATMSDLPASITITTTSGSESISDGTNTLNFGANAFNSTTIPTSYVSSVNGSTGAITNVAKTNTTQTFTAEQTFTGNIKNSGTYYIGSSNLVLASISGSALTLGSSSATLNLAGSGTRPTYNSNSLALQSDIPTDYVDLSSSQTITGNKTFTSPQHFSDGLDIDDTIESYDGDVIIDPYYSGVADWLEAAGGVAFGDTSLSSNSTLLMGTNVQIVGEKIFLTGLQNRPQYYKIGGGTYTTHDFAFLDDLYPVGAVYISTDTTSPASLFGGTWSAISSGYALWTTATSSNDAGGTISAGLPNIKGSLTNIGSNSNDAGASGAFTKSAGSNSYGNTNSGNKKTNIDFNAHNYNTIYSDSVTTVQPPAYKVYAWRRTA